MLACSWPGQRTLVFGEVVVQNSAVTWDNLRRGVPEQRAITVREDSEAATLRLASERMFGPLCQYKMNLEPSL